uniref:Knr4/Smi1-like domain-containing protein n=1 Tax=Timema bartmani TaxID=61472 RepID=A0A7R9F865_9NEOP|nr:unnamed protein product [Timema bartmani]
MIVPTFAEKGKNFTKDDISTGFLLFSEGIPGVQDIELENKMPCERVLLSSWEQRHCCTLPEDLKQFYFTSDGYRLIWNYEYAGEVLPIGNMRINSISELRRLAGLKSSGDADCPNLLDIEICNQSSSSKMPRPNFGVKCKIFELDPCQGIGKVCLVYMDKCENESDLRREDPKIWLLDRCFEWHFLANDFLQYFRTMLVHMGLPQWQFRFTPMGLTPWAEEVALRVSYCSL